MTEEVTVTPEAQEVADRWNAAIVAHISEIRGRPFTPDDLIGRFIMYAGVLIQTYGLRPDTIAALLQVAAHTNLAVQKLEHCDGRKDN